MEQNNARERYSLIDKVDSSISSPSTDIHRLYVTF